MPEPSPPRHRYAAPRRARAALLLLLGAALPAALPAEDEAGLGAALGNGRVSVDLRYRYEDVRDEAVGEKHARASTLRTAIGYRSRAYRGFSLRLEAENVAVLGNDLYDNGGAGGLANGVTDRPRVADPADTGIHRALVRYLSDRWQVGVGRQEIRFGDERFVGNVGWRQNHQSFDALRVDNSSLGGLRLTYAYLHRVNRVAGDSLRLAGHLLNAGFDLQNAGKFNLYGYLLDYRDEAAAGLSTSTVGLEFTGRRRLVGGRALLYEIERAQQSDWADNPNDVDTAYTALMLGAVLPRMTVRLGWEALEGSPTDGRFRTPLATLHRHNGWADRFLATPPDGLEDLYLQLDGELGAVGWLVRYHDFGAESRSLSYGRELDLRVTWNRPGGLRFGLKGALYDADAFAADADTWWLWAEYGF